MVLMRIHGGLPPRQVKPTGERPKFAGRMRPLCETAMVGAGAAVIGPPFLMYQAAHQSVEFVQFDHFKRTLERHPEKLESQFKSDEKGDADLHERLRWLVKSGNVALLRKAMAQKRVQELDIDRYHIIWIPGLRPKGKNNLVDKALIYLQAEPSVQEEVLKVLTQHPKYEPDTEYSQVPLSQLNERTKTTLLFWAIEAEKPEFVRTLLAHHKMTDEIVNDAMAGETSLRNRNQSHQPSPISALIDTWRQEQEQTNRLQQAFLRCQLPILAKRKEAQTAYREARESEQKMNESPQQETLREATMDAYKKAGKAQQAVDLLEENWEEVEAPRIQQEVSACTSSVLQKVAQAFVKQDHAELLPELMRLSKKRPLLRQQQYLIDLAPSENSKQKLATMLVDDAFHQLNNRPGLTAPMMDSVLGSLSLGAAPTDSLNLVDLIR